MENPLTADAERLHRQLVAWRRHFHAHPELGGREEETARFIAAELRRLGYEPQEHVGGTPGVTATLRVGATPAVALRADMDALPIVEETGAEYASQTPGVMHACGHDAHMAMLLGAAHLLIERQARLKTSVRLIFQPNEESGGGAAQMIAAGVLEDVSSVFGLHIWSELPVGTLGTRVGPLMSSSNELRIVVTGQGGHAAMPHQCVDPVVVAAEIVLALQTVVSRSVAMTDIAVVSVTQVQAGTAGNIIPQAAELRGTVRALSEPVRAGVCQRIRRLAEGIAQAHGATAAVRTEEGYPVLVNDARAVEHALSCARKVRFSDEQIVTVPAQGGAEDFAYYVQKIPGALLFLGGRNEPNGCVYPHHHPRFNIDENALPKGAALLAQLALSTNG